MVLEFPFDLHQNITHNPSSITNHFGLSHFWITTLNLYNVLSLILLNLIIGWRHIFFLKKILPQNCSAVAFVKWVFKTSSVLLNHFRQILEVCAYSLTFNCKCKNSWPERLSGALQYYCSGWSPALVYCSNVKYNRSMAVFSNVYSFLNNRVPILEVIPSWWDMESSLCTMVEDPVVTWRWILSQSNKLPDNYRCRVMNGLVIVMF